jgi:hypothetical protein
VRQVHRARVECGNLVIIQVGGDECLRGVGIIQHRHVIAPDAVAIHPLGITGKIIADRTHRHRVAAQQLEVVGDIACATTKLAAHVRHQERHIQHMHFVGQDVVPEPVVEHHDGVEGE